MDEQQRNLAAQQMIEHLKLCNWEFVKGPPARAHG
jgi:hypothetical protein